MKKQISKKLPAFMTMIIFTIAVLIFNGSCSKDTKSLDSGKTTTGNSKIVYTDVNPDSVITNNSYALDLNKDGIKDFTLTAFTRLGRCCTGKPRCYLSHVEIIPKSGTLNAIINDGKNNALALDSLAIIGSSGSKWSKTNPPAQILNCSAYCNFLRHQLLEKL